MEKLLIINRLLSQFNSKGYLVGGAVRDWLLENDTADFDLAVADQVEKTAAKFAAETGGSFVALDQVRRTYRVVINQEEIYDFSPVREGSITEDLLKRDFTINALAVPVTKTVLNKLKIKVLAQEVIDPAGGKKDLQQGLIRAVRETTFSADPLRLLRAVRFKAQLGFKLTPKTERLIKQTAKKIVTVAEERIKEELIKILQYQGAASNVAYLEEKFALLSTLIPDVSKLKNSGYCKYHQEDIWTHSVYAVEKLEQLGKDEFWQQRIEGQYWPLLKWAVLFHDLGKLLTREVVDGEIHFYGHQKEGVHYFNSILENLTFSRQEIDYLTTLVRYHMRPLDLYSAENLTFKGKYRFFRATEDWTADVCLLAAADMLSTVELNRGEDVTASRQFLRELVIAQEEQAEKAEPKLVAGDDIMELFSVPEGPRVGTLLSEVKKAQAAGKVSTREEAIDYLQEIIDK